MLVICASRSTVLRMTNDAGPFTRKRKPMSATERAKGARFELEIVHVLHDHGWPNARRTSDGREQHARGDIANGPAGCHFELKRHERLNVPKAFDQVLADADPLDVPVLVHRPSRHVVMATIPLAELLPLLALRERG